MSPAEPTVVLLATIDHAALPPGFCGRCLGVGAERRSRMRLYADVRPAALAHSTQQAQTSALLCQHFGRKQAHGDFSCAQALLLCPSCLDEDLRGLGLPEDPLGDFAEEAPPPEDHAGAEGQEDTAAFGRYALFVHLPEGRDGHAVAVLSTLPSETSLAEVLAEEKAVGVPPRRSLPEPAEPSQDESTEEPQHG